MTRRNALKAVLAATLGALSGQAIFTRTAKTGVIDDLATPDFKVTSNAADWYKPADNVQWDIGQIKTITLVYGEERIVFKTREIFDALKEEQK